MQKLYMFILYMVASNILLFIYILFVCYIHYFCYSLFFYNITFHVFFLSERSLTFNWPLILTKINYYSIEEKEIQIFQFFILLIEKWKNIYFKCWWSNYSILEVLHFHQFKKKKLYLVIILLYMICFWII